MSRCAALLLVVVLPDGAYSRPQASGGDASSYLEKLRSPTAAERASAERWLARHLTDGDLEVVRKAAVAGDAETRRRLVLALADDDVHVALAVELAVASEAEVSALGRAALEERLGRWCPAWTRKGNARGDTLARLQGKSDRPIRIDPRTKDRRLDVALDQLARLGPGAVPLVLDPDLALSDHPRDPSTEIEGTFDRVLGELVRLHRADLEGFAIESSADAEDPSGADPDPDEPLHPWIRVRRSVGTSARSGSDLVVDWCVGVARAPEPARRAACARALAATEWPGGLAWLERRAFAEKDAAALEGVLLAAGRGRVVASLQRPATTRALLEILSRESAGPQADPVHADAIARAIGAAGAFGAKNEDLSAIVIENESGAVPAERWLRLAALEEMRSPSPGAQVSLDALLATQRLLPPLRFQALRARLATGPSSAPRRVEVADAQAVLAWADGQGKSEECVRLLVAFDVPPPPAPTDAKADSARSASLRLAELEWSLFEGDGSAAAPRLAPLLAAADRGGVGLEALAARTRAWVRAGARSRIESAIAAARRSPGAEADRLDRLEILSQAGDESARAAWIRRFSSAPKDREELLLLAALADSATGAAARDALLRALTGSSGAALDDAVAAADLAVDVLRSSRHDDEALAFVRAITDAAANGSKDLRARLRTASWPPRRAPEVLRAVELDRAVESSGL